MEKRNRNLGLVVWLCSSLPSFAQTVVPSSPRAQLPQPGTPGSLAHVTDDVRGLWMDDGSQWLALNGDVIYAKEFGAQGDDATDDTAAIQAAINAAQDSGRNLSVVLGAGVFRVSASLRIDGPNKGISVLGSPWASLQQGSVLPASTIRWIGGASPVFDVTTTFTHFVNFSIVNSGAATNAMKFTRGGRILLFGMSFVPPVGTSPFSDAAVWLDGFDYSFIDRCEFETSPAIHITGTANTTLDITRSVFDAIGANPLLKVESGVEILKIERNTFNHEPNADVVFDNTSTTGNIRNLRFVANEFDGIGSGSERILLGKDITSLVFDSNAIEQFGAVADSLIQLTNSQMSVSNNWGSSVSTPLVKTLDTASRVFVGPNSFSPTSTSGILDDASESGGIVNVPLAGAIPYQARLHGNLGSPSSETVYRISAMDANNIEVSFSKPPDSFTPGYMTKGQRFTLMVRNTSGGTMGSVTFAPTQFKTACVTTGCLFISPADGKNRSITFVYDGAHAVELWRGASDVDN
jgi:hypothetical protein